ncbi:hypothetical protein ABIE50_003539 [Chitinophaga sp. OAE865]
MPAFCDIGNSFWEMKNNSSGRYNLVPVSVVSIVYHKDSYGPDRYNIESSV